MTDTAAGLHRHGWRDTGRMEKTCGGCSTIAFRVKQPDGRWQMAWRPALAEQVRRQLENAGIDKDDPGLQRVRAWNERLGIRTAAEKITEREHEMGMRDSIKGHAAEHEETAAAVEWLDSQHEQVAEREANRSAEREIHVEAAERRLDNPSLGDAYGWYPGRAADELKVREAAQDRAGLSAAERERQDSAQLAAEADPDRGRSMWSGGIADLGGTSREADRESLNGWQPGAEQDYDHRAYGLNRDRGLEMEL